MKNHEKVGERPCESPQNKHNHGEGTKWSKPFYRMNEPQHIKYNDNMILRPKELLCFKKDEWQKVISTLCHSQMVENQRIKITSNKRKPKH